MSLLQKRLQQRSIENQTEKVIPKVDKVDRDNKAKDSTWLRIKKQVQQAVIDSLEMEEMEKLPENEQSRYLSQQINQLLDDVLKAMNITLNRGERHRMVGEMASEIIGYGPITSLLADSTINEVMVNGPNQVYIERNGKLELTDITFRDENHVLHVIDRIVSPLGKRIDESSPMVDARLPDGSRVNATIQPTSLTGPVITIRKFAKIPYIMSDLITFGTLSSDMAAFLKACVEGRMNIVVGGGTASGKTTTLNVLSSYIPNHERIITIEDAAELKLQQEHIIRLESRPPNIEGKGRITIRDLVINSLRMRPDRIVVGEVRGGEALDMLQAMNTGHEGSITTGHANSPRDLLARLETMVLMAGVELPLKAIREQIASALDLIVYQSRLRDGTRKITNICEVVGMEGDVITMQDIFVLEQNGMTDDGFIKGKFRATGIRPKFLPVLKAQGIHLPDSIFS